MSCLQLKTLTVEFATPCDFPQDECKGVHVDLAIWLKVAAVHRLVEHFGCHVATCALASVVRCHVYFTGLARTTLHTVQLTTASGHLHTTPRSLRTYVLRVQSTYLLTYTFRKISVLTFLHFP